MDSTPFYGERGPIPFFLGRKSSVCKKRLWTKWFYILSQPLCSVSYQEIFRFEMQKCQQCAILVSAVDELAFPLNKGVMLMTNEELALLLAFLQLVVSIIALLK